MSDETAACGDEERATSRVNRITASMAFPDGDPRKGPFSQAQVRHAQWMLNARNRWHLRNRADMFAVQLQHGRGLSEEDAALMFGIGESSISDRKRKTRQKGEVWIANMSERDRRRLAVQVWLGGLLRLQAEEEPSREMLDGLSAASVWTRHQRPAPPVWRLLDEEGEAQPMTVHIEIPDDAYYTERDPYRDERAAMRARFQAELDAIEARTFEEEEEGETDARGETPGGADQEMDAGAGDAGVRSSA